MPHKCDREILYYIKLADAPQYKLWPIRGVHVVRRYGWLILLRNPTTGPVAAARLLTRRLAAFFAVPPAISFLSSHKSQAPSNDQAVPAVCARHFSLQDDRHDRAV